MSNLPLPPLRGFLQFPDFLSLFGFSLFFYRTLRRRRKRKTWTEALLEVPGSAPKEFHLILMNSNKEKGKVF